MAQELRKRVRFDRGGGLRELASKGASEDVATWAEFEGDATVGEEVHQGGVVNGGNAGADTLEAEEFDGFANFLRTANFTGVHKAMKTQRGSRIGARAEGDGTNAGYAAPTTAETDC